MYTRALESALRRHPKSVLLLGPRQTGKSTLLGSLGPDLTLDFSSAGTYRQYVSDPSRLELELLAGPVTPRTILIDEVQRVPAILDSVQHLLDTSPERIRFLLSGSSARKLRRGQANLLPGRVHVHHLHPLLASELGDDFDLDGALAHGTLPGIYAESDPEARAIELRSYADTYLREEIQAEALVRDVGGYSRLLDLVAASSGRILNLSALARDVGIGVQTARRYLDIMDETLVLWRIPGWSGSDRASIVSHPKVLLFDLGVRNALLRRPLDRPLPDERGLLLEHLVGLELLRRSRNGWPEARVFHFRTRTGREVDYVVEVGHEVWGIEVKASDDVRPASLGGFAALGDRTDRLKRRIVVFLGPRRMAMDDVEVIPLTEFLAELPG
jgi:predicted AAA+ superfamily ATPase